MKSFHVQNKVKMRQKMSRMRFFSRFRKVPLYNLYSNYTVTIQYKPCLAESKLPIVPFKSQPSILPLEVIACVPHGSLIGRHHSKPIGAFLKIFVTFMTEERLHRNKRTHRPMRERGGTLEILSSG